jgi:Arc/MetJ-type ribon-helix-helix transcriptional regulator
MAKEPRITIKIPKPLYLKIKDVIKGSSYNSVTDFIIYVLRDVVSVKVSQDKQQGLTRREIGIVKQRLKSLGYL